MFSFSLLTGNTFNNKAGNLTITSNFDSTTKTNDFPSGVISNINLEKEIPNFSTKVFETNKVINSLDIFVDNEFYILNIWASWCIPCRAEHPFLVDLSKHKNLKMIGLNYKDNFGNAKNFLDELQNPFDIILLDDDGTIAIELGDYGVPESFLIYKKKIIKKIIGPITNEILIEIKGLIK